MPKHENVGKGITYTHILVPRVEGLEELRWGDVEEIQEATVYDQKYEDDPEKIAVAPSGLVRKEDAEAAVEKAKKEGWMKGHSCGYRARDEVLSRLEFLIRTENRPYPNLAGFEGGYEAAKNMVIAIIAGLKGPKIATDTTD